VGEARGSHIEVPKMASDHHPARRERCHREQDNDDGNDLSSQEKPFESNYTGEAES